MDLETFLCPMIFNRVYWHNFFSKCTMTSTVEMSKVGFYRSALQTMVSEGSSFPAISAALDKGVQPLDPSPIMHEDFSRDFKILVEQGHLYEAFKVVDFMQGNGVPVSRDHAYHLARKCFNVQNLECGRRLQLLMYHGGLDTISVLADQLIRLFTCCERLVEANQTFNKAKKRNPYVWGAILSASSKLGEGEEALHLYDQMLSLGVESNKYIYLAVLKACITTSLLKHGRFIHSQIIDVGIQLEVAIGTMLIDMYTKCGGLEEAETVFNNLSIRNVVTWGAMIAGYVEHGMRLLALECYNNMKYEGLEPDKVIFLSLLKGCACLCAVEQGRCIHEQIIHNCLQDDIVVGNTVINMYGKCRSLEEASDVFTKMAKTDVISWNAMIAGYIQHGKGFFALDCYENMHNENVRPSRSTYLGVLKACTIVGDIEQGRFIHEQIIQAGLEFDVSVGSMLIDMYAKCGDLEIAHRVFERLPFRNVVSWGAMIEGYAQQGEGLLALDCFDTMQHEGIKLNNVILLSLMKACGSARCLCEGKYVHEQIIHGGLQKDIMIGSTLIDMYCKCGNLEEAFRVFSQLPSQDVVSWGAMISGYAECEEGLRALECFHDMTGKGIAPDKVIFLSILKACGNAGAIHQGKNIHGEIVVNGLLSDEAVGSAIVDMYGNCGDMKMAFDVFKELPNRNVILWGALVAGYAQLGDAQLAMRCLVDMQANGVKPDNRTLTAILTACGHAGILDEGRECLRYMRECHGILPNIFHNTCMVDLLGHAGCFAEAEDLVKASSEPNIHAWISLLSSCTRHGNVELGRRCFNEILRLNSVCPAGYVLMSNINAMAQVFAVKNNSENIKGFTTW